MALRDKLEEKGKIVKEMRDMLDANPGDKWTAECETRYVAQNESLKKLQGEIDGLIAEENTRTERVKQLDEIETKHRDANGDRRIGVDADERRRSNPEHISYRSDRVFDLAVQAAARSAQYLDLRDDHKEACKTIGVQFHRDGAIDVPLASGFPLGQPAWTLDGRQQSRQYETRADANMLKSANVGMETVPEGFGPELERTLLAFGGPRSVCRVWRTPSGNSAPWPTIDDTANSGAQLAEEASIGDTLAAATAAVTFDAYKISSKPIKMSAELLQDEAVGLGSIVGSLLGERLGRAEGALTTTGSGSSTYKGIVTCSTLGKTAASATAIASEEILDLVHAVNPAYRQVGSVGFMLNDGILLYLRKLKDGNGQFLWQPGLSMGVPDRLAGYPLTINQHMQATVATATKTVLFGDFSKFIIREVASIRFFRLDELYRATDQTGFVAFLRGDSDCIQTAAIKHLVQA